MFLFFLFEDGDDYTYFHELYERYKRLMLYRAEQILHDRQLAEDSVQDACVKIMRNIQKIRAEKRYPERNLIVNIIESVCIDMLRKQERTTINDDAFTDDFDISDTTDILLELSSAEAVQIIKACIDELRLDYRVVIEMRMNGAMTHAKIGDYLGLSEDAVKMRMFRARKALLKKLRESGVDTSDYERSGDII